jgi:hypothetical protein
MLPNASEPESGSVMAQAPILFMLSKSGTKRSFCARVPRLMIAPAVKPTLTPHAVMMPKL